MIILADNYTVYDRYVHVINASSNKIFSVSVSIAMFIGIRCLRLRLSLRRSGCRSSYYYNYYSSTQGPESDDGPHCDDNDDYGASEHLLYPCLSPPYLPV
jgi:hypothetical protein